MSRGCELACLVALEAALFFSLPAWLLAAEWAWPAEEPLHFLLTVLLGASAGLVLCHVVPAWGWGALGSFSRSLLWRRIEWIGGVWFSFGAAVSLLQLAALAAGMAVGWGNRSLPGEPAPVHWHIPATAVMISFILGAVALAWRYCPPPRVLIGICLAVGAGIAVGGFVAQARALSLRNAQLSSEEGFHSSYRLAMGMLLSAAPGAIIARRIGDLCPSTRRIWATGVVGVWLPLCTSVTLVSIAKMLGVRQYWKPSLPVGALDGFIWMTAIFGTRVTLWILGLTILIPATACSLWIVRFIQRMPGKRTRVLGLAAILAAAFPAMSLPEWSLYYRPWLASIILGNLALLCVSPLLRSREFRRRLGATGSEEPSNAGPPAG